jgi:hypothetical protein
MGTILNNINPTIPPSPFPDGGGSIVNISVGEIPPDDTNSLFVNYGTNPDSYIYPDYKIKGRYFADGKRFALPVTNPEGFNGNTVVIVQLAPKLLLWVVDWTAFRNNECPAYPDYQNPPDKRWVLLDEYWEPFSVTVGPDGNPPMYRLSGTLTYVCLKPSTITTNDLRFSIPPWLDPNQIPRTVPTTAATKGIL